MAFVFRDAVRQVSKIKEFFERSGERFADRASGTRQDVPEFHELDPVYFQSAAKKVMHQQFAQFPARARSG